MELFTVQESIATKIQGDQEKWLGTVDIQQFLASGQEKDIVSRAIPH